MESVRPVGQNPDPQVRVRWLSSNRDQVEVGKPGPSLLGRQRWVQPVGASGLSARYRGLPSLLGGLRAGFTCRVFVGTEVRLDLGFDAVQARLATLVRGGLLRRASAGAFDEWQACLAQAAPWVTALGMSSLVQVRVRDMVTHADCATWAVRWEVAALDGSLVPALDADIKLSPAGVDTTVLAVCGAYRPLGVVGIGLDRAVMRQVADVMIWSFTTCIRMAILHPAASAEA
jgi:hypothetical protein